MINNDWKIPLYKIFTDDEDLNLITKIVKRGSNWAMGSEILEFENEIKNYLNVDHCSVVNSGTSALHASLLAKNIKESDEVIIPSFTFISTANSVKFVNANPIFSDIEDDTLGLDPEKLKKSITKNTKAIIPVDIGGLPCKINEINQVASENKLHVIEDAAEGFGASVNQKKLGTISEISIFSFCGNKVLTTGEGGAIVSNNREFIEKIKLIRSHGRVDQKNYFDETTSPNYLSLGYNWRMSSITAALGITQLQKLDKIIKMRQNNAKKISNKLSKCTLIKVPMPPKNYEHIYQMYTIKLPSKEIRDKLQNFLTSKKIFSKVYFKPIHLYSFYHSPDLSKKLSKTMQTYDTVLTLPLYPNMTNEENEYLTSNILEFFEINDFT